MSNQRHRRILWFTDHILIHLQNGSVGWKFQYNIYLESDYLNNILTSEFQTKATTTN